MKSIRTKIVATAGPRSDTPGGLFSLVHAGADIIRLNFSHCTPAEYRFRLKEIRKIGRKSKQSLSLMQDLQGPRIRVGSLPQEGIELREGATYVFSFKNGIPMDAFHIPIDDPYLHADIRKGDPLYLANGALELVVTRVSGKKIFAEVMRGGLLLSRKGVNVPRTTLTRGGLTPKDIRDVQYGIRDGFEYIALSFVQSGHDVEKLRRILGKSKAKIIAKIERAVALDSIEEIIKASDGIMVARGDLGIEMPLEDIPLVQKELVRHAHWLGKPVIIATQMLTSMINHPHPTRAEVSDIANAVLEGADMLMLSNETGEGAYGPEAVALMRRIAVRAEQYLARGTLLEAALGQPRLPYKLNT